MMSQNTWNFSCGHKRTLPSTVLAASCMICKPKIHNLLNENDYRKVNNVVLVEWGK